MGQAQLDGIQAITNKIDLAKNSSSRTSNEEILSIAKEASVDYIQSLDLEHETEQEVIQLTLRSYDNPTDFETVVSNVEFESQKNYMYQIKDAIEKSATPEAAIKKLDLIEQSAISSLNNE